VTPVSQSGLDWAALRQAAADCTRCDLYQHATQTVFGEGPVPAVWMLVGEQPGDDEDNTGRPFTGPSGELLDRALKVAGVDRDRLYVTNAVKHFKWTPRGKRRIHQTPNQTEIVACRPWLEDELRLATPALVGLMGAVAAKSLLGTAFRVTQSRGQVLPVSIGGWSGSAVATVHPSSILRAPDPTAREEGFDHFVADLRTMAAWVNQYQG
jgi:DNA polymerase